VDIALSISTDPRAFSLVLLYAGPATGCEAQQIHVLLTACDIRQEPRHATKPVRTSSQKRA